MFAKDLHTVTPAGDLVLTMVGYIAILAILVIFGIWGFRLGSGRSDGNGGGGPKKPAPHPPPPPGGCERGEADQGSTGDFAAWEEQLRGVGQQAERSGNTPARSP